MGITDEEYAQLASLIGEPARARMLWRLLDGRALTATELCVGADLTMQNASNHLRKLVEADLLAVESQGRHRYYRFARPEVAYVIESIAGLKVATPGVVVETENLPPVKFCRTCYDHLAGRVAVRINQFFLDNKFFLADGQRYVLADDGNYFLTSIGMTLPAEKPRRVYARPCLDWSERRHHVAGTLGASLLQFMKQQKWISTRAHTRLVLLTPAGEKELRSWGVVV